MTPSADSARAPWWIHALVGVLSAAVGLAVGELVAGLVGGGRSPVIAIGDAVIDLVPAAVKEFAIAVFGQADKLALVMGILILLVPLAGFIGVLAARRFELGAGAIVALGALGALAALTNAQGAPAAAAIPSVAAVAAGVLTLHWLTGRLEGPALRRRLARGASEEANHQEAVHQEAVHDETVPEQPPPVTPHPLDRRTFLRAGAVLAAGAVGVTVAGRWLQARASAVASRAAVVLSGAVAPLPPLPAGTDLGIPGLTPFVTPNASFYRIDTALSVPQVNVDGWRLRIFGMVGRPMELTFADLQARELVEADVTIACVSNEVGGDLIGNARWMGVRLADVLAEAEVDPRADQIVGRSVDGFTAGFPTAAALDGREALIAIGMNGEPLPLDHGFPARLIVPGLYGYVSATKWLAEIELTTFDAFNGYWIPRGWSKEAPIKTQSRIDVPRGAVSPGRTAVAGVAWAQGRGIERVEVQVDEEPWAEARLAEAAGDDTWRQWVYEWNAEPGSHRLRVRATDRAGDTQGERRVQPIPNGAEGWHTVVVDVTPGP